MYLSLQKISKDYRDNRLKIISIRVFDAFAYEKSISTTWTNLVIYKVF